MPNLTPIPLTEEEHERLTSLKHKLEANSWREMLMKLCDIHEEYCQMKFDLPLAKEGIVAENPEFKDYVDKLVDERLSEKEGKEPELTKLWKDLSENKKGGELDMEESDVRRIIKEELENWRMELPEHTHKKDTEPCEGCGTEIEKGSKYCSGCGEELDWEEEE